MFGLSPNEIITSIYLPLLMSFIVGIPLAIYTGLVAGRMVSFTQAKHEAVIRIQTAFDVVRHSDTPMNFIYKLGIEMNPSRYILKMLGHPKAEERIRNVVRCIHREGLVRMGLDVSQLDPYNLPRLEVIHDEELFTAWLLEMTGFYIDKLMEHDRYIAASRPNLFAIWFGSTAGVWLETKCDKAVAWAYANTQMKRRLT